MCKKKVETKKDLEEAVESQEEVELVA